MTQSVGVCVCEGGGGGGVKKHLFLIKLLIIFKKVVGPSLSAVFDQCYRFVQLLRA